MAEDKLGLQSYYEGIATFLKEDCNGTGNGSVTLAIQGGWGEGKTTLMHLIDNQLGEEPVKIWFNTWQFSVFGQGHNLISDLLVIMSDKLDEYMQDENGPENNKSEKKPSLKELVYKLTSTAGTVAGAFTQSFTETFLFGDAVNKLLSGMRDKDKDQQISSAPKDKEDSTIPVFSTNLILDMQDSIQDKINKVNEKTGKNIYFFIDDLDRLEPKAAVDFLEGVKNFIDCDHCVFILAIDQDVVKRGLQSKYGADFGEEKTKKFFDKIIQVPFHLPVRAYQIDQYVKSMLKDNMNEEKYIETLNYFKESNPRTIKRSFSLLNLYDRIESNDEDSDPDRKWKRYCILLLQMKFPEAYEALNDCTRGYNSEDTNDTEQETEQLKRIREDLLGLLKPYDETNDAGAWTEQIRYILQDVFPIKADEQEDEETEDKLEAVRQFLKLFTKIRDSSVLAAPVSPVMRYLRVFQNFYDSWTAQDSGYKVWTEEEDWKGLDETALKEKNTFSIEASLTNWRLKLNWHPGRCEENGESNIHLTIYPYLPKVDSEQKEKIEDALDKYKTGFQDTGTERKYYNYLEENTPRITLVSVSGFARGDRLDEFLKTIDEALAYDEF